MMDDTEESNLADLYERYPHIKKAMDRSFITQKQRNELAIDLLTQERSKLLSERQRLTASMDALNLFLSWWESPPILERNDCSRLHKFIEAATLGKIVRADLEGMRYSGDFDWKSAHPFVVQHNWASVFQGANDYTTGDYRIPYPRCVFEFRVTGKTVLVLASQDDGESKPNLCPMVEFGDSWWMPSDQDDEHPSMVFLYAQIKAISIALDAEVAVRDAIRAPHKLNQSRIKKDKPPLRDYHIVKLNRKPRVTASADALSTQAKRRLHFRRGHWRHYEKFKTWVKWCLVGNPDLGFIDKEYHL